MKKLALVTSMVLSLGMSACEPTGVANIPKNKDLKAGGVYVAYNLGCDAGCDGVEKGDLIQKMDGKAVTVAKDLDGIADGKPHKLEMLAKGTMTPKTAEITATPKDNIPPIKDAPPFWLVGAEELNRAPDWARRRVFGHVSPSVMLVSSNGGILDGRQLHGTKRFVVYWDWGDREEEAAAIDFMQVLQKAQGDLKNKNIEVLFVHVRFQSGRKAPMNDSDLRTWQKKWTVKEGGKSLPEVPMYRFPNETEFNAARELGMEGSFTMFENLGSSPTIVMLDENGVVRWHSEGVMDPLNIGSEIKDPEQATIIAAVQFAVEKL